MSQQFTIIEGELTRFQNEVKTLMQTPITHFEKELAAIRTGRASTTLVETLPVECYGQVMKLREIASLNVPDARMITIQPWDKGLIGAIEKALLASEVGITPSTDGDFIRLQLPQMTSARREELIKLLGKKIELCRVGIRNVRKDAQNAVKEAEKKGTISEDFAKRLQDALQKTTDSQVGFAEGLSDKKENELKTI